MEIINCEQNTPEWYEARRGVVTASAFSDVMAKGNGATRKRYLNIVAGELITGNPNGDKFSNAHMQRGHDQEEMSRKLYEIQTGNKVELVGFVKEGRMGCSPDGLIGDNGGLEIKSKLADLQIAILLKDEVPTTHRKQIQGSMLVTGRQWWDFVSYCPGLPIFIKRVERDESLIAEIGAEIEEFLIEVDEIVEKIQQM